MTTGLVSIIIPSRNEKYLQKTINDLLSKATGPIEVIAVLDGYWPQVQEIVQDKRVHYIHFGVSHGMRACINAGVSIAQGEFILKSDAHCMFSQGYDKALKADCSDNWVVVPRRKRLDPEKWEILDNGKPDVDYMYLSNDLHGVIWNEKAIERKDIMVDDLMSSQGSCWFMKRTYFDWLELMDEEHYGTFAQEFQEIGLKAWLSGGKVKVNKNCWYAHWHKEEGRGYSLDKAEVIKAENYTKQWKAPTFWHKQIFTLDWLIWRFRPVPSWDLGDKGDVTNSY